MTSLFSPRWHRVAALRPRLVPQLVPRRQRVRGQTWIVLQDPASGRGLRLNAAAYAIAARLDGTRTVQATWEAGLGDLPDPPTQDEVLALLAQLREAGFVQLERAADFDLLLPHFEATDAARRPQGSPLAWRLPLLDPTRWLARLRPVQRLVFTRTALGLWLAAVASLVVLALQNAPLLAAHARAALASPRQAVLALVLMVPVKALHELAHALAVRRRGGAVRSAGVTLMMGMPLPWVDASAAAGFARRRDRVLVGAAGMMSELALAAAALPAWLWLHARGDGWLADALFAMLAITGVSTLLFNANPLQRFDGYFLLVDALELPNLGTRSRQWWLALLRRRLLGSAPGQEESFPVARGETAWLAAYAPLAWLYALALSTAATFWLAGLWLPLGVAGGTLLAVQALRAPLGLARALRRAALAQRSGARRWRRALAGGALVAAAVLLAPWPQRTIVQGVVWPADAAQLRAGEDGFVESVAVGNGETVAAGDVVLRLANPALAALVERQAARVASLEATAVDAQLADVAPAPGGNAGDARAGLAAAQAELERLQERTAGLVVRAQVAGRVALGPVADLPGRFFHRGALVGQVQTPDPPTVRMAWRQADLDDFGPARADARRATVQLASSRGVALPAVVARDGAGAVDRLPSAALSERHGGPIATDPKDADDLKPLEPVVLVDVRLAPAAAGARAAGPAARIGERAWVRLDDGFAPLAWQWLRAAQHAIARRVETRS
jgi:putative peptide zinc metalloprotease protein